MREQNFSDFLIAYEDIQLKKNPFVVVTMVKTQGSAPQDVGARMIVSESGLQWGTVGGGKLEARAISEALKVLKDPAIKNQYFEWNLQTEIGMTCGGLVGFFFEKHDPSQKWNIVVFGAGHVGQALITHLIPLDANITCIDSRQEWIKKLPNSPNLKSLCLSSPQDYIDQLPEKSFIVIMTMGHATDLPILAKALNKKFPYVGNMGSRQKSLVLKKDLVSLGLSEAQSNSFYCPIGETFGGNTPHEIAISVVAQLLKIRDQVN